MSEPLTIDNAIRCVGLLLRAHEKSPELGIFVRDEHALCAIIPVAVAKKYAAEKGHRFPEWEEAKTPPLLLHIMGNLEKRSWFDVAYDLLVMAQEAEKASAPTTTENK